MKSSAYVWLVVVLATTAISPAVRAQTWVPVGTAEGGVAVYFNNTNEVPTNVSYLRVQYSGTNTNGAHVNMFEPFKTIFGDLGQYGFDLIAVAPTNTNPTPPALYAYDWNGSTPEQNGKVLWAMNVYSDWYNGPKNASATVLNSTLRGTSGTPVLYNLTSLDGGSYKADFAAILESDKLIHWYHPVHGTSALPYPFTGRFLVQGTLQYTKSFDTNVDPQGMDFYAGTMNLYAEAIPDAATVTLFGTGLLPLAALLRRRNV